MKRLSIVKTCEETDPQSSSLFLLDHFERSLLSPYIVQYTLILAAVYTKIFLVYKLF